LAAARLVTGIPVEQSPLDQDWHYQRYIIAREMRAAKVVGMNYIADHMGWKDAARQQCWVRHCADDTQRRLHSLRP